jgi:hypothetical protein
MSIAPFRPAPTPSRRRSARRGVEARRARLALLAAIVGIAAALIAYAISPTVRREFRHAEHSVKHTVTNIFDHDHAAHRALKAVHPAARRPPTSGAHAKPQQPHTRAPRSLTTTAHT